MLTLRRLWRATTHRLNLKHPHRTLTTSSSYAAQLNAARNALDNATPTPTHPTRRTRTRSPNPRNKLKRAFELFPIKAIAKSVQKLGPKDMRVYDVIEHSGLADYVVMVETFSSRHMVSMAQTLIRTARARGVFASDPKNQLVIEGRRRRSARHTAYTDEDWMIVDLSDVYVHFLSSQAYDVVGARMHKRWSALGCHLDDLDLDDIHHYKFRDPRPFWRKSSTVELGFEDEVLCFNSVESDDEDDDAANDSWGFGYIEQQRRQDSTTGRRARDGGVWPWEDDDEASK